MSAPEVGTVMLDGSIYVGASPQTGRMLFVMPADIMTKMTLHAAESYADALNHDKALAHKALNHNDWRLPTRSELNLIFCNKEKGMLKGTFNEAGEDYRQLGRPQNNRDAAGWYRSTDWGSAYTRFAQLFKTGDQAVIFDVDLASVRYVRDGEPPGAPLPPPYTTPDNIIATQSSLNTQALRRKPKIKPA